MLKIYYMTFGCKVNQYETELIRQEFSRRGHLAVDKLEEADVCVVNSCAVTSQADTKLRHFLSRARRQAERCIIALCGCFPQAFSEKAGQLYECDIICGSRQKERLPLLVEQFVSERRRLLEIPSHELHPKFEESPMISPSGVRTRAIMKIQDGCDCRCAYCVIPRARGHICSKPLDEIISQASALIGGGCKEIVLTGINLCCYGRDLAQPLRLIDAIEAVCAIEGDFRVRLGSMEPEMISDDDIARMRKLEKLCPQFHLSLQSGCKKTLEAMRRNYTPQEYFELCQKLRAAFENCAITTDIMVGFPGETEEDHNESLKFAKKVSFASAHIFPYSRRSGTEADAMPEQIDPAVKAKRAKQMAQVCAEARLKYHNSFVGKKVSVLFEREGNGEFYKGHTREYILVKIPRGKINSLRGRRLEALITEARDDCCIAKLI